MTTRRLAAILAADVVGFSKLMGADEEGTLTRVKALRRDLIEPTVQEHHGRVVKTTGDGFLIEFASPVEAVRCAVSLQEALSSEAAQETAALQMRVGINVGDIIIDDDGDIYGDGVNVAARLEQLADPGGVCLSGKVYEEVRDKLDLSFEDRGEQEVKNIARPVRVFALPGSLRSVAGRNTVQHPDKPSIAILPFTNLSDDRQTDWFADGVVEDIITALSRFKSLFVVARNSSFTYKGKAVNIKQVGRELGVRYVLEGSIRRAGAKLRITGQLIDAETGSHVWADRIDGSAEDVFGLQDFVTEAVVRAIAPHIEMAERERLRVRPPSTIGAYELFLRGKEAFSNSRPEENLRAEQLALAAVALDHTFGPAYGLLCRCFFQRKGNNWPHDPNESVAEVQRYARLAVEFGRDDAICLSEAGFAVAFVAGDLASGLEYTDRALALNPNLAAVWLFSGWVGLWRGDVSAAIGHFSRAMRTSAVDPTLAAMQSGLSHAYYQAGEYDNAITWAEKAMRQQTRHLPAIRVAAASLAMAGRLDEAKAYVSELLSLAPSSRVSNLRELCGPYSVAAMSKYEDGVRRAGLPE